MSKVAPVTDTSQDQDLITQLEFASLKQTGQDLNNQKAQGVGPAGKEAPSGDPDYDWDHNLIGFTYFAFMIIVICGMNPSMNQMSDYNDESSGTSKVVDEQTAMSDFLAYLTKNASKTGIDPGSPEFKKEVSDFMDNFKKLIDNDPSYDPKANPIPATITVIVQEKDASGKDIFVTKTIANPFYKADGKYSAMRIYEYAQWKTSLDSNYRKVTVTIDGKDVTGWKVNDDSAFVNKNLPSDGMNNDLWNAPANGDLGSLSLAGLYDPSVDPMVTTVQNLYSKLSNFNVQGNGSTPRVENLVEKIESGDADGLGAIFHDATIDSYVNANPSTGTVTHPKDLDVVTQAVSTVGTMAQTQTSQITQDEQTATTKISGMDNAGQQAIQTASQAITSIISNFRGV